MNYDDGEETARAKLENHVMEGFENNLDLCLVCKKLNQGSHNPIYILGR